MNIDEHMDMNIDMCIVYGASWRAREVEKEMSKRQGGRERVYEGGKGRGVEREEERKGERERE